MKPAWECRRATPGEYRSSRCPVLSFSLSLLLYFAEKISSLKIAGSGASSSRSCRENNEILLESMHEVVHGY